MKVELQLKYMDFMMNQSESTGIQMYGNISPMYLISYPFVPLLKIKFSVYMEDYPPLWTPLMTYKILIENKKYLTKVLFAIYYGPIPIILPVDGEFHPEEPVTYLVRKSLNNLIMLIILQKLLELINYKWKDM
mmetsp:Transcript_21256/g.2860  ORF Transcript_21256/g.2860 Transcript_21256/m.2860 type:complete len:133 (+) Transcript_21256:277-675(+)